MAQEITLADELSSPAYRDLLSQKHGAKHWGGAGKSWAPVVAEFAERLGARTILDYGCGRGTLAPALPAWTVAEYDPGIAGKDALPAPADLIACTDVLEHIEPDRLDRVLDHIGQLMVKGAFLLIALSPSKVTLADGRNAHLIVEPAAWWIAKLRARGWNIKTEMRKGLCVWVTR